MKIYCDDQELFEISEQDYAILQHDLSDVDAEIKRRLQYIISHKVDQCFARLKQEWDAKLAQDDSVTSVPNKRDDYVAYVTSRRDYLNKAQRDAESAQDQ